VKLIGQTYCCISLTDLNLKDMQSPETEIMSIAEMYFEFEKVVKLFQTNLFLDFSHLEPLCKAAAVASVCWL
jgi:hypothetical protein